MHHDNSKGLNDFDQLFEIDEIGQCVLSNTCLKLKIENTVKTLSLFLVCLRLKGFPQKIVIVVMTQTVMVMRIQKL